MRRLLSGPALVILLIAAACLGASPAATAEKPAGPEADALILGRAASPALKALRSAADLDTTRGAEVDRLRPQRYDMLVVDGHHLTADELRRRPPLQSFLAAGKWIAAFDVLPSDHEALRTYTGFDVADGERRDRSEMFAFRASKVDGTPTVQMIDSGPLTPGQVQPSKRREAEVRLSHARYVARILDRYVDSQGANGARLQRATELQEAEACTPFPLNLKPAPDPEVQHVGFCYVDAGQQALPKGHWSQKSNPYWVDSLSQPGSQTAKWTMNHRFDVFLNNGANSKGDFQTIAYSLNGQFNPKLKEESFYRMYEEWSSGWFPFQKAPYERAWWTARFEPRVRPSNDATDKALSWVGNHPQTANSETQYTSGEQLDIGFTASGTAGNLQNVASGGLGVSVNYSASSSTTYTIPDWGVQSDTSGNDISWTFSSRKCDARKEVAPRQKKCFQVEDRVVTDRQYPVVPSDLSRSQLQVNASAEWNTQKLLTGQTDDPLKGASLKFDIKTPVTVADTYCVLNGTDSRLCSDGVFGEFPTGPSEKSVAIDASRVNPIPIKALELKPNPANGTKNEQVTGTVTLERATKIPVTIKLFSSERNADVGKPLGGGVTEGKVTIDPTKSSGTFTILTNDNGLVGENNRATATITAFYAEPVRKQLTVQRITKP